MQCALRPEIPYVDLTRMLRAQRMAVYRAAAARDQSSVVREGLVEFHGKQWEVPGVVAAGWRKGMDTAPRVQFAGDLKSFCLRTLNELSGHGSCWPFLEPVSREDAADYYDVIKEPMDMRKLRERVDKDHYRHVDIFVADVQRMFDNCRLYNPPTSPYVACADALQKFFRKQVGLPHGD